MSTADSPDVGALGDESSLRIYATPVIEFEQNMFIQPNATTNNEIILPIWAQIFIEQQRKHKAKVHIRKVRKFMARRELPEIPLNQTIFVQTQSKWNTYLRPKAHWFYYWRRYIYMYRNEWFEEYRIVHICSRFTANKPHHFYIQSSLNSVSY